MSSRADRDIQRPVVGVLVNKKKLHKRSIIKFAGRLYQANERVKCSVYFFTAESINWKKQSISGYILSADGKEWLEFRLPFPDIIYDRGAGYAGNERAMVEGVRSRFRKMPEIQFINSSKLKKWQVHQRLSKYKETQKYLPATINSCGLADIREMLKKHSFLFLKSSGGSGGKSVFALEKNTQGYCFRYYHKGCHQKRYGANLDDLRTEMKTIGLKPERVIIQQGIRLVHYRNRPLDLRVLLVKDKHGDWKAVYNQARVAKKGTIITNVCLGGEAMNYRDIFSAIRKRYPGIPPDKKIRRICIMLAWYIEQEFGPFGEIGMDIGVEVDGRVWLLEANSKPSKLPEKGIEETIGISPQFLMTLEYAMFLYSARNK